MRVHLLRHGQTVAEMHYDPALGVPNPSLAAAGIRQAELLGQRLRAAGLEALYSSDLLRAVETAQRIQAHVPAPLHLRPELREISMGAIPTQSWEAFPEIHREWLKHETDVPYPGGEAGRDVQRRAGAVLTEILERHQGEVALVTHGGVIMVLVTACMGIGQERRFRLVAPANCSLSTLLFDPAAGLWRIERYNDSAHLSKFAQRLNLWRERTAPAQVELHRTPPHPTTPPAKSRYTTRHAKPNPARRRRPGSTRSRSRRR